MPAALESEGKSLAPPAFQLKASEGSGTPPANCPPDGGGAETMETSMTSGAADRAADKAAMDKR